ncbi:MAG: NUDIX domain-containing protein [Chloroflexi bacterium]|nr:NUDIX domain-containing protein [Chloroflexota bacterium]
MLNVEKSLLRGQEIHADNPDSQALPCWYANTSSADYFTLVALNESGEALIFEDLTAISAWGSWHMVSGLLKDGENPLTAVRRQLLKTTGYDSNDWLYLGSFMLNNSRPDVTGHFFFAHDVQLIAQPRHSDSQTCAIRWVPQRDLKYALFDGRIGIMSYAFTVAMAMLMFPQFPISRGE